MSSTDSKNILISGASGLIGTALIESLSASGYRVFPLDRKRTNAPFTFNLAEGRVHLDDTVPLHGVINLAGASIADGRWSNTRKQQIWNSRIRTTELLTDALANLQHKPEVFISASAIGFYGNNRYEVADESSNPGDDFLARLSVAWEQAADRATAAGIRTIKTRFGLVLSDKGGVLENLVLPMSLAVVGRLGDGNHLQSWISIEDAVACIIKAIENESFSGPVNLVAPEVVSNDEFSRALSYALGRPRLPALPAAMVRLMFGELADAALLASSNITSTRLNELGVSLRHPTLEQALKAIYGSATTNAE